MKNGQEVLAAVCLAPNEPFRFERVTLDDCRDNEVIVRIAAVGLCHTDLAIRDGLSPIPPFPSVLGHEGAGIVEEIGRKVTRFKHIAVADSLSGKVIKPVLRVAAATP